MLAAIPSATCVGVDGREVRVEVHVSNGLPGFAIVGLPDTACREARDRVRAALLSSGEHWPQRRITVNLAPSSVRKEGSGFDLAIAVGLLVAEGLLSPEVVAGRAFIAELGLDGSLRPVPGVLPMVASISAGQVVVAEASVAEASLVRGVRVRTSPDLATLLAVLRGNRPWPDPPAPVIRDREVPSPDLADVRGQPIARWALEVAAAGGHGLLLVGPPGVGKSMLVRRLPGLLPDLDDEDALEVTRIHSVAGLLSEVDGLLRRPPFRAPHHTASRVAMVGGGGTRVMPGEVSLAHRGVLFLDELAEFPGSVLETLRQPIEEGVVRIVRARESVCFPARFMLVGATNPCPCGSPHGPCSCTCTSTARARYTRRLSGPLLDRFDLRVEVSAPHPEALLSEAREETTAEVAGRVRAVRERSRRRGFRTNAEIPDDRLDELAPMDRSARQVADRAVSTGRISARGLRRIRLVALTLADLEDHEGPLRARHLEQSLLLRADLGRYATGV
ncbi:MAG: ATP-dependent protease [Acidimicrobiales bacterium]|nr:MAG: ATP-dependent protease [Acidimicrobiales bacterium]